MTSPKFSEDFEVGMSQEYGDYLVIKEEILEFALNFDPQPFHLSEGVGKAMDFGGLCASGFHTSAIAMRMTVDNCLLGRPVLLVRRVLMNFVGLNPSSPATG